MKKFAILTVLFVVVGLISSNLIMVNAQVRSSGNKDCTGNVYIQKFRKNVPCYMVDQYLDAGSPKRIRKMTLVSSQVNKAGAMTGTITGSTNTFKKKAKTFGSDLQLRRERRSSEYEVRIRQGRGVNYVPHKYMNRDDLLEAFDLSGKKIYAPSKRKLVPAESLSRNRLLAALKNPTTIEKTFGKDGVKGVQAKLEELGIKGRQGSYATYHVRTAPKRDSYRGQEVRKYFAPDRGSIVSTVQDQSDTVR